MNINGTDIKQNMQSHVAHHFYDRKLLMHVTEGHYPIICNILQTKKGIILKGFALISVADDSIIYPYIYPRHLQMTTDNTNIH